MEDIVNYSRKLEEIIAKYNIDAEHLKNEYAVSSSKELEKAIKEKENEDRQLKIGIVGRVKAGKSSLLNALFFDGKDILPKAATPMTASLTILEYGDKIKAEIDFFDEKDIEEIKEGYENFLKIYNEKLKELKSKRLGKKNFSESLEQRAIRKAKREADERTKASFEQYESIKNSSINISQIPSVIEADTIEDIQEKLIEYVGANGKYMPFTKSVTLKLPIDTLKDVQIIDTPGINDPVISREERTRQLLKYCDVIFIISPSGQFFSKEDTELLDRITQREGIRELYVIASQVDNQLFGSEKNEGNGDLHKVIEIINTKLSKVVKDKVKELKEKFQEVGNLYDSLCSSDKIILSSAMAYKLKKRFDEKDKLSDMAKVWENLNFHYPDYFSNREIAFANLDRLSNISKIKEAIEYVKQKKKEILEQRKREFISAKFKALKDFKADIIEELKKDLNNIKEQDIENLKRLQKEIEAKKDTVIPEINEAFNDLLVEFEIKLKRNLYEKFDIAFRKRLNEIREQEGEESTVERIDKGHGFLFWRDLFGKRYEERTVYYKIVRAGAVRNIIEDLTYYIENIISLDAKEFVINWRKKLYSNLVSKVRKSIGDENVELSYLQKTLRKISNNIELPDITYSGKIPDSIKKSGTLKEYDAEKFMENVSDYISELKGRVRKDIDDYIRSITKRLEAQNIGEQFFKNYDEKLKELQSQIENKEIALERLSRAIKELEGVNES